MYYDIEKSSHNYEIIVNAAFDPRNLVASVKHCNDFDFANIEHIVQCRKTYLGRFLSYESLVKRAPGLLVQTEYNIMACPDFMPVI